MKGDFKNFLASLLPIFLLGAAPIALAQPQSWTYRSSPNPCFFRGTATIDGADVEVGDIIGAFVDADAKDDSVNVLCIGKFTITTTGVYGLMNAYGDDPSTEAKDGADVNETVYFKIWDASLDRISYAVADGNTQWEIGGSKTVNLSATSGISADASGNRKDAFELTENIYGKAILALKATTQYDLYVVYDRSPWSDGDSIPSRLAESESSFTTDASGNMEAGTILYSTPAPGNYDIVIDVNANGIYNDNVDYLDDSPAVGAIVFALGDVSQDGNVTPYDAALVLQYVAGVKNLSPSQRQAADVTDDGTITALDAALILQYTVGLITRFPSPESLHD
jgi:hypothetical protein